MTTELNEQVLQNNITNTDHNFLSKSFANQLIDETRAKEDEEKPSIIVSPNSPCVPRDKNITTGTSQRDDLSAAKKKEMLLLNKAALGKTKRESDLSDYLSDVSSSDEQNAEPVKVKKTFKESKWVKLRKAIRWHPFTQSYKKEYPWIQLAGHEGGFKPGHEGTILKCSTQREVDCLVKLQTDILQPFVPKFFRELTQDDGLNIEMQDLLHDFESPTFVMDCKMGIRTYLEDEINKAGQPRQDLYNKMISVDPSEPTEEERKTCSCTKSRYMIWREQLSSTATLGFRIEGIKRGDNNPDKDFKKIKTDNDVSKVFLRFIENRKDLQAKYLEQLHEIKEALAESIFFKNYEIIGSSLLFVHDASGKAGVWLIDFGKTVALTNGTNINHKTPWVLGNHEDGYLIGLENLINIWTNLNFEKEIDPL